MADVMIIIKPIDIGHKDTSSILSFVDERYLNIDERGNVSIVKNQIVVVRKVKSNSCFELMFDDGVSYIEVFFDDEKEKAEYLRTPSQI